MATQLNDTLWRRVHPPQRGFVPTRGIHSIILYFHSDQDVASNKAEYSDAVALLLDFSKAYDTLDRT